MRYLKLMIVIIWMVIIFWFSNQKASDSDKLSNGLILKTVRIIEKINHKHYSDEEILNKFVHPVRKTAHFFIYFILGILVYIYLKEYGLQNIFIISIMICCFYACTDEIHQLFIDNRSGELLDVINDTISSFIGIFLVHKNNKK